MKKTVLAVAVAAALATPFVAHADTILYGSARVELDYIDEDPVDSYWDVVNSASRLGVRGSEDLGGGLSAIYQYEFGVDMTEGGNFNSNRPKYVGLKGGFGQLTLGTQDTPYYNVAGITDIFNTDFSFGATAWLGGSFNGFRLNPTSTQDFGEGALFRLDNSVYYSTPDFNGFSGQAMLVLNGDKNDTQGYSNGIDEWNISALYSGGPFFAGISYIQLDGDKNVLLGVVDGTRIDLDLDLYQWVVGLGYSAGPFSVGFIYEQGTINEFGLLGAASFDGVKRYGDDEANNWYLTGEYKFGNNTLRAAYGQLNTKLDEPGFDDTIDNYLVGYQYDFSKRTRIWVEYIGRSADTLLYGDSNIVSIGTRVDF